MSSGASLVLTSPLISSVAIFRLSFCVSPQRKYRRTHKHRYAKGRRGRAVTLCIRIMRYDILTPSLHADKMPMPGVAQRPWPGSSRDATSASLLFTALGSVQGLATRPRPAGAVFLTVPAFMDCKLPVPLPFTQIADFGWKGRLNLRQPEEAPRPTAPSISCGDCGFARVLTYAL